MPDLMAQLVGVVADPALPLASAELAEGHKGDAECPS